MLIAPRSRSVPQGYVYVPQPNLQIKAFSNLDKVLTIKTVNQILTAVQKAFPQNIKFINPQKDAATLDWFAYDIDSQEK
jgi:hypothetical protein